MVLLRTKITWWLVFVSAVIHGCAAVAQPFLAGAYLNGDAVAMQVHGPIGSGLVAFTMFVLGPAALLFIVPGKGPFWPLVAVVLLFFAEGLQIGMGYSRQFGVHIPLGVAIVGTACWLPAYLLAWRVRLARKLRGAR